MKFPIYIPSKGRADKNLTARMLSNARLPFWLVVERNDYTAYCEHFDQSNLLMLPGSDYGGVAVARNFIKDHACSRGYPFHWQLDDDIARVVEVVERKTISKDVDQILTSVESFVDDFENIAAAGLRPESFGRLAKRPYQFNGFVYSLYLLRSDVACRYTQGTVEGIDFNLQLRTNKLCTVLFSRYLFQFSPTAGRKGGNTEIYQSPGGGGLPANTLKKWPQYLDRLYDGGERGLRVYATQLWRHFKDDPLPTLKPHVRNDKYAWTQAETNFSQDPRRKPRQTAFEYE